MSGLYCVRIRSPSTSTLSTILSPYASPPVVDRLPPKVARVPHGARVLVFPLGRHLILFGLQKLSLFHAMPSSGRRLVIHDF